MGKWVNKWSAAAAILLLLGGGWWWRERRANRKPVETFAVGRNDVKSVITASGQIRAEKTASLKFPAAGKLGFIKVAEGDRVVRGQALAGMDTADLGSAVTEAHYKYLAADAAAKQAEDEVKGHDADETFVQKNKRVAAQTARDIAYDNWREAQRDLRDAVLYSPMTGIVTEATVTAVGATVAATDMIIVVDPESLYFSLEVDEADVGRVETGQKAEVVLDALPLREWKGEVERVAFVSSVSDSGATVYETRIKILGDEGAGKLRLGMNGEARIVLEEKKDALTLPIEAVVDGKVKLGLGEEKAVEVGLEDEERVEIKSGLSEGERVLSW